MYWGGQICYQVTYSGCWRQRADKGNSAFSLGDLVADEERMRPKQWLGSVLCVSFTAVTPLVGRQEGHRLIKVCATYTQRFPPEQHTHTHPFNGSFSRTTRVSRYQKGKTNLDFTIARDSEWQWRQLGHMQVCVSLQTDNHAITPQLKFFYRPDALPAAQPTASKHCRQTEQVEKKLRK